MGRCRGMKRLRGAIAAHQTQAARRGVGENRPRNSSMAPRTVLGMSKQTMTA
jgi:hypothetical protein